MKSPLSDNNALETIHAEDLVVGHVYDIGSYDMTEAEIIDFATAWDPLPIHIDPVQAQNGFFGGIIASGLHTIAVYQRLCALGPYRDWAVIAGRSMSNLELPAPVRPHDTLVGTSTVAKVQFKRGHRAVVTLAGQLSNQDGIEVMSLTMSSFIRARTDL